MLTIRPEWKEKIPLSIIQLNCGFSRCVVEQVEQEVRMNQTAVGVMKM